MKRILPLVLLVCHAWLSHGGSITNVNTATPNSGTGDPLYTAFNKLNTNDNYLAANYVTNFNGRSTNESAFGLNVVSNFSVRQTFYDTPIGTAPFGANLTTLGGNLWPGIQGFWHNTPTGNRVAEGADSFYYAYGQTAMIGAVAQNYGWWAGNGSALSGLPPSGPEVWAAMPKPYLVLDCGGKSATPSTTCNQVCASNGLMAALSGGIINFFTNRGGGIAMLLEDAWPADHLDSGGYLMWRTNNFPMNTGNPTNLTYFCLTNGAELWVMSVAGTYISAPTNWPSSGFQETDIDASGAAGSIWEYPGGTAPGSFVDILEPMWTPDNIRKFVSQLYGWGVQGIIFQDGAGAANSPNFLQVSRVTQSAIQNPFLYWQGGGGSATVPATLLNAQNNEFGWYYLTAQRGVVPPKHPMIFGQKAGGTLQPIGGDSPGSCWPLQASLYCNIMSNDSNEQSTEPAGIGAGLAAAMAYMRPKQYFVTNATSYCHTIGDGDSYTSMGSYTYADFQNSAGQAAVASRCLWAPKNGGTTGYEYLNSTACDAILTNQFWFKVWQDVSGQPPTCIQIAPSNAIVYKVLTKQSDEGARLVWLANEAQQSTNLTITAGQLGLASNVNMTVTEVFTNLVWSNVLNAVTVTVPANSSLLLKFKSAPNWDPSQIGGLAYFWTYEDLPIGTALSSSVVWRDRVQGAPLEQDAAGANTPTNSATGVDFNGTPNVLTNGAGFQLPAVYSIMVSFNSRGNASEPVLIGDITGTNGLALKWATPKASLIYTNADHVSYSLAQNVSYDWLYTDAGTFAASSGNNWTNGVFATAITGAKQGLAVQEVGSGFNGTIKFIAIWTNTTLTASDAGNFTAKYSGFR